MAEAGIIIATAIASVLLMDWLARGVREFFEEAATRDDPRGEGCNSGQRPTEQEAIARSHGRGL